MARERSRLAPALFFGALAVASVTILSQADAALGPSRRTLARPFPAARAAWSATGRSRAVRMLTSLPALPVEVPLEFIHAPVGLRYEWVPVGSMAGVEVPRPLSGTLIAPSRPGFYRLAIERDGQRQVIDSVTLGVMKPLAEKRGASINGYRIGFFRGERRGGQGVPDGLLEVREHEVDLPVSEHFALGDFLTHDQQTTWPRYVAIDPRLLDKLELVFEEIARLRGSSDASRVAVDLHSGFRTPLHNQRVPRAASDSRHQYGDAADIAVDANGDGRVTWLDVTLIARAVDAVERAHPELAGGLGQYSQGSPYAHIDVRGTRVRWRG
ncbi:MAG: hypothetical protein IPK85_14235 [Gemmatimonadetes bacterium]|nr:hypothetical protein [Gemmatimonadota bacterium]